jgi:RHS repeat-associated protein
MMFRRFSRCASFRHLALSVAFFGTLLAAHGTASAATSVFDGANRLVSTTEGSTTVTYAYDGLGNLAKRCVNGTCTDLVLDDSSSLAQVVGEAPAGAAIPTTYAYGPAGVAAQRAATSLYPMTDSLGSVRGLADATGVLSGRRATDAFGATRGLVGAASSIGYAGEFTGAEDGKVWLRARIYDPKTGRFDQRDTFAGYSDRSASLNRYGYGEGNPIVNTDPSGFAVPLAAYLVVGGLSLVSAWFAGANPANAPSAQDAACALSDNNLGLTMLGELGTQLVGGWVFGRVLAGGRAFVGMVAGKIPGKVGEALRTPLSKVFSSSPLVKGSGRLAPKDSYHVASPNPPDGVPAVLLPKTPAPRLTPQEYAQVRAAKPGDIIPTGSNPNLTDLRRIAAETSNEVSPFRGDGQGVLVGNPNGITKAQAEGLFRSNPGARKSFETLPHTHPGERVPRPSMTDLQYRTSPVGTEGIAVFD